MMTMKINEVNTMTPRQNDLVVKKENKSTHFFVNYIQMYILFIRLASSFALGAPILGDFKYNYDSQTCSKDLLRRSFKYTKL